MSKKSYMSLLKEAIAEFDTSDHLDVKGPMLDPILSWDGGGELPVYKDAASILERYYYEENQDKGVMTVDEGSELESEYQNDKGSASGENMKNAKGTGTEQAGTSDAGTITASKDEKAKNIAKEYFQREQEEEESDDDDNDSEESVEESFEFMEEDEDLEESEELEMENAIIEKLIAEMEEEDLEEADVMNYTGEGPKDEAPKEKKASGPEEDTHGAGTQQAGTGSDEKHLPDRKDKHNTVGYLQGKFGFHLLRLWTITIDGYGVTYLVKDVNEDYWNNYAEIGPGIWLKPLPELDLKFYIEWLEGRYFGIEKTDDPNPNPQRYHDRRLGILFWFGW